MKKIFAAIIIIAFIFVSFVGGICYARANTKVWVEDDSIMVDICGDVQSHYLN